MKNVPTFVDLDESTIIIGSPELSHIKDLKFPFFSESMSKIKELPYSPSSCTTITDIPPNQPHILYFVEDYYPLKLLTHNFYELKTKITENGSLSVLFKSKNRWKRMKTVLVDLFSEGTAFKYRGTWGITVKNLQSHSIPSEIEIRKQVHVQIQGKTLDYATEMGLFSYGELDEGTQFLLETVDVTGNHLLDFGCGSGVISLYYATQFQKVVAIDENARAVRLAQENGKQFTNIEVIVGADLSHIKGKFDFILANPPTHVNRGTLTKIFKQMRTILGKQGAIYLVVNQITSYEDILEEIFGHVQIHATKNKFKILELKKK